MADAGRPIHVQADRLIEASTTVAAHLENSAKQPTSAAPHLTAPAAPVDAAATQAAAAMRAKMAQMSTELAAKGPATQQAATAAATSLQAQDAANSARLPSIPSPPGGSGGSGRSGAQMLGSGPSGSAPPPRAPQPAPPPPRPPPPRPTGPASPSVPDPRLRHLPPPSWTRPAPAENSSAAQRQYQQVIEDIKNHNSWRPDPSNDFAVTNYNREAQWLNESKASLEDQLNGWKAPYDPSDSPASDAHSPLGTPAENPHTPRLPNTKQEDSGGGRGDWNPQLRKPEPNTTYSVDGGKEVYVTDSNGLTQRVDLHLDGPQSPGPDSRFRPPGMLDVDHSGHLVPKRFGGPGEEINLTAQQGTGVNLSQVKIIENEWAKILQQTGHLDASIEIVRDATGRPIEYIYDWQPLTGPRAIQVIGNK